VKHSHAQYYEYSICRSGNLVQDFINLFKNYSLILCLHSPPTGRPYIMVPKVGKLNLLLIYCSFKNNVSKCEFLQLNHTVLLTIRWEICRICLAEISLFQNRQCSGSHKVGKMCFPTLLYLLTYWTEHWAGKLSMHCAALKVATFYTWQFLNFICSLQCMY
jgi:hypothetical protein